MTVAERLGAVTAWSAVVIMGVAWWLPIHREPVFTERLAENPGGVAGFVVVVVVPGLLAAAAFGSATRLSGAYVVGLAACLPACLRAAGEVSWRFAIERSLPPIGPAAEPVYQLAAGWYLSIVPALVGVGIAAALVRRFVRESPRHPRFLTQARVALALAGAAITVISTLVIDDGVMLWDLPGTVAWTGIWTSCAYTAVVVAGILAGARSSAAAVMVVAAVLFAGSVVTIVASTDDRVRSGVSDTVLLGAVGFGLAALATSSAVGIKLRHRFAPTGRVSLADHEPSW